MRPIIYARNDGGRRIVTAAFDAENSDWFGQCGLRCVWAWGGLTPVDVTDNAPKTKLPLLLTRPISASKAFWSSLQPPLQDRLTPFFSQLVEIVPLPSVEPFPEVDVVLFTSSNGVACGPEGEGRRAVCVGQTTTAKAQARGWLAECGGRTVDELIVYLSRRPQYGRILHISGVHTLGDLVGRLAELGRSVERRVVYDQRLLDLTEQGHAVLRQRGPKIVPLFSPRTARQFASLCPPTDQLCLIAMSDSVARAVEPLNANVAIAPEPTANGMRQTLQELADRISAG
ncbi:MAG: uroporphyrinogen-III synthase [Pseudomonadota bacterium]